MPHRNDLQTMFDRFVKPGNHTASDYFGLLRQLVAERGKNPDPGPERSFWQEAIDRVYRLLEDEIRHNPGPPAKPVKFGTSGWRGLLGKDLFVSSVSRVALAIGEMYRQADLDSELREALGVESLAEAQLRGCLLGYDNRFGGAILADSVAKVLTGLGFTVYEAGESTTGVLSAALLELKAAFSINLTPSHNPLDYGGFKFNAADGGPAAPLITNRITALAGEVIEAGRVCGSPDRPELRRPCDALGLWLSFVARNGRLHTLNHEAIVDRFFADGRLAVAIDSVHGASRVHMHRYFGNRSDDRLFFLRDQADPTFGGIAPEPSTVNLKPARELLASRPEPLKLGMIIDPDADRIRFTDGTNDIDMNRFGGAAYYFLHQEKGLKGPVAKSVATSNFANAVAEGLGEEVFETRVGFKEFKPYIGRALVMFEESDGISILGHTPEKDAYIGLLLALEMVMTTGMNLSDYIAGIEERFGPYYPARSAITVSLGGKELHAALAKLEKYREGETIAIGDRRETIARVIDIDGRKMILSDGSWLMIRPSGTEPKVRFYVEARTPDGCQELTDAARDLLAEIGLID